METTRNAFAALGRTCAEKRSLRTIGREVKMPPLDWELYPIGDWPRHCPGPFIFHARISTHAVPHRRGNRSRASRVSIRMHDWGRAASADDVRSVWLRGPQSADPEDSLSCRRARWKSLLQHRTGFQQYTFD